MTRMALLAALFHVILAVLGSSHVAAMVPAGTPGAVSGLLTVQDICSTSEATPALPMRDKASTGSPHCALCVTTVSAISPPPADSGIGIRPDGEVGTLTGGTARPFIPTVLAAHSLPRAPPLADPIT